MISKCSCLCSCLSLRHCFSVGPVMSSDHSDWISQRSQVSVKLCDVLTCEPRGELPLALDLGRRSWEPWPSWSQTPSSLPSRRSSRFLWEDLSFVKNRAGVHFCGKKVQFPNSECVEEARENFCASTAQKLPHSQTSCCGLCPNHIFRFDSIS